MCPCPFVSLHPAASPRSVAICAVPSTSASLLSSVLLTTGVLFGVRPRLATRGPEVNRPSRAGVPVPVHGGGGLSHPPRIRALPAVRSTLRQPREFSQELPPCANPGVLSAWRSVPGLARVYRRHTSDPSARAIFGSEAGAGVERQPPATPPSEPPGGIFGCAPPFNNLVNIEALNF